MSVPSIDFGIVNYNGGASLVACVQSILAQQSVSVRVWVCDNGSTDGSIDLLRQALPECVCDLAGANLGYAGACNRLLAQMQAPVQVLCNMDLEFDSQWGLAIHSMLERHPECGSVASFVLEPGQIVNAMGVLFHPDLHAENECSGVPLASVEPLTEKQVFGCYGAVMAFRREVVERVGPMDHSFFLFFEETEWYLRQNVLGFTTWFCPQAKVYHERSRTTIRYSTLKLYYAERNRVRCALRYLPWGPLLALPFHSLKRYTKMARTGIPSQDASGKKNPKWKLIWTLIQAWGVALWGVWGELQKAKALSEQAGHDYRKRAWKVVRQYPAP